jgi:hypothetical protein
MYFKEFKKVEKLYFMDLDKVSKEFLHNPIKTPKRRD